MNGVFERQNKKEDTESAFAVKKLESGLLARRREMVKSAANLLRVPRPVQLAVSAFLIVGIICLGVFFELFSSASFEEMVADQSYLFLVFGAPLTVLAFAAIAFYYFRARRIMASSAYAYTEEQIEKLDRECLESLGVPETAVPLDVFGAVYKIKKNGAKKRLALRDNLDCRAYREDDALILCDREITVRIPLSEITRYAPVKKRIAFCGWNQTQQLKFGKYKGYKVRMDDWGNFVVKPYLLVTLLHNYEEYELAVPPYEEETLSRLLGRTAE